MIYDNNKPSDKALIVMLALGLRGYYRCTFGADDITEHSAEFNGAPCTSVHCSSQPTLAKLRCR
jgi:hypothetical protein